MGRYIYWKIAILGISDKKVPKCRSDLDSVYTSDSVVHQERHYEMSQITRISVMVSW